MDLYNGNRRIESNAMYAFEWAKSMRRTLNEPFTPFLLEWKDEEMFITTLFGAPDPEVFGYESAEKSERNSDQFVIGYEAEIGEDYDNRKKAIIIKAYDKTQSKGVALFQHFLGLEDNGEFMIVGKTTLLGQPDFPYPISHDLSPNFDVEEVYVQGIASKDGLRFAVINHDNPALVAITFENYFLEKLNSEPKELNGRFKISIPPKSNDSLFAHALKDAVVRVKKSEAATQWESEWNKKILINISVGEKDFLKEFENEPVANIDSFEDNSTSESGDVKESEKQSKTDKVEETTEKSIVIDRDPKIDIFIKQLEPLSNEEIIEEFSLLMSNEKTRMEGDNKFKGAALASIAGQRKIDLLDGYQKSPHYVPQVSAKKKGCTGIIILLIALGYGLKFLLS